MSEPFRSKFSRSWQLLTRSLAVIVQHKKLLLFPIISTACVIVMALFFLAPAFLYPSGYSALTGEHWQEMMRVAGIERQPDGGPAIDPTSVLYVYGAVIYLVSMFIATFFNVAYYSEIMKALSGDSVSVRAGLRVAWSRLAAIALWSLFAGIVGLVIKSLEEKFGFIGRSIMRLVGVVWSVASIFVIPVIIRDGNPNPVVLLRHSALTLRKTWGESLIGYLGISLGSGLLLGAVLIVLAAAFVAGIALGMPFIPISAIVLFLVSAIILGIASQMAGTVYRCALYIYASEGVVPAPYDASLMDAAWKVKKA